MSKSQDEKRQNRICALLCKCKDKKSLLAFYEEFDSYFKDNDIPNENVALTLSVMFQDPHQLKKQPIY